MTDRRADEPRHLAGRTAIAGPGGDGSGSPRPEAPGGSSAAPRPRRAPQLGWVAAVGAPGILAAVTVGAGAAAVALSGDDPAAAVGVDEVVATPVLSARRVPEVIAAPVADRRLDAELDAWLAGSPADTCLVVATEGRDVFAHNPPPPSPGHRPRSCSPPPGCCWPSAPTPRSPPMRWRRRRPGRRRGRRPLPRRGRARRPRHPRVADDGPRTRQRVVARHRRPGRGHRGRGHHPHRGQRRRRRHPLRRPALQPVDSRRGSSTRTRSGRSRPHGQRRLRPVQPVRTNADTVPAADPAADAARVLTERLVARGIAVGGAPALGRRARRGGHAWRRWRRRRSASSSPRCSRRATTRPPRRRSRRSATSRRARGPGPPAPRG